MAVDSTSPITPARVQVLLLPAGNITHARFVAFVERVLPENAVRLSDVTPDPTSTSFSPLAFPQGLILYKFSTALPPSLHIALSPFETFREPFIVICISDGAEYIESRTSEPESELDDGLHVSHLGADLHAAVQHARNLVPRALVILPLVFEGPLARVPGLPMGTVIVPRLERANAMKTVLADVSSVFLRELSLLARSIQIAPPLDLLYNASHGLSTAQFPLSGASTVPLRTTSLASHSIQSPGVPIPEEVDIEDSSNTTSMASVQAAQDVAAAKVWEAAPSQNRSDSPASFSSAAQIRGRKEGLSQGNGEMGHYDESALRKESEQRKVNRSSSGNISDFANSRMKGRQAVILGSFYLQAGRWPDAFSQLVEGATKAKTYNDHLWCGKALENLLVTMLLLASAGFEYQIPQICTTQHSRSSTSKRISSAGTSGITDVKLSLDPSNSDTMQLLSTAIPDMTTLIANTYARAGNAEGELPFQFAFSESVVRLARLQVILHLAGGRVTKTSVTQLILATTAAPVPQRSRPATEGAFRRHISDYIMRCYPPRSRLLDLPSSDSIIVLSGMASTLASVGLRRKEAFINRQLLSVLTAGLKESQKSPQSALGDLRQSLVNFSEGSSRLPQSVDTMENVAVNDFLRLVCLEFGVCDIYVSRTKALEFDFAPGFAKKLTGQIIREHNSQLFSSPHMKVNVLRYCATVTEALADHSRTNDFISAMFATTRPIFNPSTGIMQIRFRLRREEQIDLTAKLYMNHVNENSTSEAPYWDPFLLRGIEMQAPTTTKALYCREKSDFSPVTLSSKRHDSLSGPFLHNAFSKLPVTSNFQRTIAVSTKAEFVLSLQNLYEFELEIDALTLLTEGVQFQQQSFSVTVGPNRVQRVVVSGVPLEAGVLRVLGCRATIRGCREEIFLLFPTMWKPKLDIKVHRRGLLAFGGEPEDRLSEKMEQEEVVSMEEARLSPDLTFDCAVIPEQPLISVMRTTLRQSNIVMMQGENYSFSLTLQNDSATAKVDFIQFTLRFSVPSDQSVTEKALAKTTVPLRWQTSNDSEGALIEGRSTRTFQLELDGVLGTAASDILIEYASLGQRFEDVTQKFYTRQAVLPIELTVNPAIQLSHVDVLPYPSDALSQFAMVDGSAEEVRATTHEHAVLLDLCFFNAHAEPLRASIESALQSSDPRLSPQKQSLVIQPGQGGRIMVPFPKLDRGESDVNVSDGSTAPNSRITLVRSAGVIISSAVNRVRVRKSLMQQIKCSWTDMDRTRGGDVDLSNATFDAEAMKRLQISPMITTIRILGGAGEVGGIAELFGHYHANMEESLTVEVNIRSRAEAVIVPYLHLTVTCADEVRKSDDETGKYVAWSGPSQRPCPRLRKGQTTRCTVFLCFLAAGVYRIRAEITDAKRALASDSSAGEYVGEGELSSALCTVIVGCDKR